MHNDEIDISDDTVRGLIAGQFPDRGQLRIRRIQSSGTVNAIFRIGDELAARLPLKAADPVKAQLLLDDEVQASREFAQHSPVPAPIPVAIGGPTERYPLPWSVQTWLRGIVATKNDLSGSVAFAHDLAALISTLRAVNIGGRRFHGNNRGGDLHNHDEWVKTCLRNSEHVLNVGRLGALWDRLRDLPRTSPDVMSHGDLIPANLLVADGRLAAVLDCGGFGPADPALDVIAGWHLLDDPRREVFRAELRCDDVEWERSKAWAFEQAIGAVLYADSNKTMSTMGRRTLSRIVANTST